MVRRMLCDRGIRRPDTVIAVCIVVLALGRIAIATPRVFLSPEVSTIIPDVPLSIDVYVENVTDLRLYEVVLEVTSGSGGSLDLTDLTIDEARTDFVFAGIPSLVCLTDPEELRITCTPLSDDCVSVVETPAYLGTYTFVAPPGVGGTFHVSIADEPTSFLLDCNRDPITPIALADSTIRLVVVPAVSEWGMLVLALLVLMAGTVVLRRRERLRSDVSSPAFRGRFVA